LPRSPTRFSTAPASADGAVLPAWQRHARGAVSSRLVGGRKPLIGRNGGPSRARALPPGTLESSNQGGHDVGARR
jgi:hypothetical protein